MAKTYSKAELDAMMAEATAAVELLVKNEVAALKTMQPVAKSEGASVQDAQDKKAQGGQLNKDADDPAASPEASGSAPAPDASASAAPPADGSAGAPPADASAAAPADPAAAAGGAPTMEELVSAYGQLSPDELKLHMQAMQQVMASQAAAAPVAAPAGAPAGAPPPDASMSAAAPAAPAPGPDATAPMPGDQSQGVKPEFAMKAEKLEGEVAELKKSLALALDVVTLVVSQPKVKSIEAQDMVLNKGEQGIELKSLSKSQINDRLNVSIRAGKLTKSDGELVKGFFNGTKQVADIAHLLK